MFGTQPGATVSRHAGRIRDIEVSLVGQTLNTVPNEITNEIGGHDQSCSMPVPHSEQLPETLPVRS